MYNTPTFFNIDVLKEVLIEYKWPLKYELKKTNSREAIIEFPKCSIVILEGFESKMDAYFLNSQTGRSDTQHSLKLSHAIDVLKSINPQNDQVVELKGLVRYLDIEPSL